MIARFVRYVPHHDTAGYVALGWCASPALAGTHHGEYCTLMLWLCACPVAVPLRRAAGEAEAAA